MNADDLLREALRHAADGTQPARLSHSYLAVSNAVAEKLGGLSELERALLLRDHATLPEVRTLYDHVYTVAIAAQMIRERQDAGRLPPYTPKQALTVLSEVTGIPIKDARPLGEGQAVSEVNA